MFSLKIRYTLYGMILTTSLITLVAQATTTDGVFGEYFRRMVGTCNLSNAEVLTGFDSNPSVAIFGTKACTTLTSLLDTIGIKVIGGNVGIGTVAAPTARLQVVGMVKSSPTTIADSSDTLTTRSYVDAGLVDMCTKIGGIWDYITNKCDTIYWQIGSYGPCSESCGPGTQDAPYVCKDNFGTILTESSCDGKIKPPNASRDCTEKACVGSYCSTPYPTCASYGCTLINNPTGLNQPWKKGSLSCGFSCDGGFSGPTCSTPPLSYSWQIGSYGPCSESCGLGVEFAPYVCKDNMGTIVADSFCASAGAKPEAAGQACNKGGCPGAYCSATAPTCASNGGCTLGQAPTTPNQSYVKNSISCGFTCAPNYSGNNCETYTASNACSATPPSCSPTGCTLNTGSPTSVNQSWVKGAGSCGFTCAPNYSGTNCETYTSSNACNSTLPTCHPTGCTLNEGSPSSASQTWIKDASSCGYICKSNYSGTNCETYTAPVAMCDYMGVNENRFTVPPSIPEGASPINATYNNSPFSYIGPSYDPIYGGDTILFDLTGYNSITGYYLYNNAVLNSSLGHTSGWWGGPITYGNCHY